METDKIIEILNAIWPIFVAIGSFMIYKFVPYLKTKIFKYEYYNLDTSFFLVEYELIGTIVVHVVCALITVIIGIMSWENAIPKEYYGAWALITLIYILGIILIVRLKTERGPRKYVKNTLIGIVIHLIFFSSNFVNVRKYI